MRTIPLRIGPVLQQAIKQLASATLYPVDLVEDMYALLRLKGVVFPTEDQEEKLIDYYADENRYGKMAQVLFKRRLAMLKMMAKKPIMMAAINMLKNHSPMDVLTSLMESLRASELAAIGHCCAGCKYINQCQTGTMVKNWNIANIRTIVTHLSKLSRHVDCPQEAEISTAINSLASISEQAANMAGDTATSQEITPQQAQNFAQWQDDQQAQAAAPPEFADDDNEVFWGLTGADEGDDEWLRANFQDDDGSAGFSRDAAGRRGLSPATIRPLASWLSNQNNNLIIYQFARILEKAMLVRKAEGDAVSRKTVEEVSHERTTGRITDVTQATKLTATEQARPDDVREHRIATGEADIRQFSETIKKPQLIYILVDVSGSMGMGQIQMPSVPIPATRRMLVYAFTAALLLRSRTEGGAAFIREYEGRPHGLMVVDPDEPQTYQRALAKFMNGQETWGGGTNLQNALDAAFTDLETGVLKYSPKDLLVLTDGEDGISDEKVTYYRKRADAMKMNMSLLLCTDRASTSHHAFADGVYADFRGTVDNLFDTFLRVRDGVSNPADIIETVKSL